MSSLEGRYFLRFLEVSQQQAVELGELYQTTSSRERRDAPGVYVATVEAGEVADDRKALLGFIERHDLPSESYGLFVSVVSEADTGIVSLPAEVVGLLGSLGSCGVDFSFTVV